jgi:transposase
LTHRHPAECEQQAALPVDRQCLPNRAGEAFDHRAIQASAPRRTMPGTQAAGVRRVVSTLQRYFVWDIENFFCWVKQFRAIATRYDKTARNFLAACHMVAALCWLN